MSSAAAQQVQQLARAARMLAIVGASIRLRSAGPVDPAIRELIERGAALALGEPDAQADQTHHAELLTLIEMAMVESSELFRNAAAPTGWTVEDPLALAAMGRASAAAFDRILALAETTWRRRRDAPANSLG